MPFLALLLTLQATQDFPEEEPQAKKHPLLFGPVVEYWLPQFRGKMRVDGSTPGSTINFVHDLDLPDDAAIPIFGGGKIGGHIYTPNQWTEVAGVAEYWTRSWKGKENLASDLTLGDETFPTGTSVESRFRLTSVTLDIRIASNSRNVSAGGYLSIQITSARLRMDSSAADSSEDIDDIYWGGGLFVDIKPVPFLLAGLSVKGFTSFGDAFETGAGDFRFYGGAEWGPFRIEGGFRIFIYNRDVSEESLQFSLYGAYVQGSIILRF